MQAGYMQLRNNNIFSKYKLIKRCDIVIDKIKKHCRGKIGRILDIGACDGKMLGCITKDSSGFFKGAELIGIEPNQAFLSECRDANIQIKRSGGETLEFPDNYFNVVINSLALEHIKDAQRSLAETYRVLDNNGLFVLITVMPFYHELVIKMGFKKNEHFRNYSAREAVKALEELGFEVVDKKSISFPLFYNVLSAKKIRTPKNA